jgi:large subunit ribosomal protein L15
MARRLPKRGFVNPFRKEVFAVNLGDIAARFTEAGASIDVPALKAAGLVPRSARYVKVLGSIGDDQSLAKQLAVHVHFISASARKKLEAVGGAFHEVSAKPKADKAGAA